MKTTWMLRQAFEFLEGKKQIPKWRLRCALEKHESI